MKGKRNLRPALGPRPLQHDIFWYGNWTAWDLENEIIRFTAMLRSPSFKKFSRSRRARYGKRLREAHAALLAVKLSK